MPIRTIPAIILAAAVVFSAGFLVGRQSSPTPVSVEVVTDAQDGDVTLRRSGQWVRVFRGGELSAEWQPADGAVWGVLDLVLRSEWKLVAERYPEPGPVILPGEV